VPSLLQAAVELHSRAAALRQDAGAADPAALADVEERAHRLSELLFDAVRGAL
jgi:hypothetical protein